MLFIAKFLMEMLCSLHGLGSQKMPDANLHTLGNLHNQANSHIELAHTKNGLYLGA